MAVFLNRNKRPLAAPIEVAELLSEKPPPSHTPHVHPPLRKGARGRGFSLEKPPPPEYLFPYLFVHVYDAEALLDETLGWGEDVG